MKFIQYIIPTLLALNLIATGYTWWSTNSRLAPVEQLGKIHDSVLLQVVCTTRVTGIIDLAQCSQ
jgi:hypothetical protein